MQCALCSLFRCYNVKDFRPCFKVLKIEVAHRIKSCENLQFKVIRERKTSLKRLLKEDEVKESHLSKDDIQKITEIRRKNGQWLDFLDILILTRVSCKSPLLPMTLPTTDFELNKKRVSHRSKRKACCVRRYFLVVF